MVEKSRSINRIKNLKLASIAMTGIGVASLLNSGCTSADSGKQPVPIEQTADSSVENEFYLIHQVALSELLDNPQEYIGMKQNITTKGLAVFMGRGTTNAGYRIFEDTPENRKKIKNWENTFMKREEDLPSYQRHSEAGRYLDADITTFRISGDGVGVPLRVPVIRLGEFSVGMVEITGHITLAGKNDHNARINVSNPQGGEQFKLIEKIR